MALVKGPAQQLADYMIRLSREYYHSEWAMGLEYELWNEINGGQDLLTDGEVAELLDLSRWCKGWVSMKYSSGGETLEFMLLDDWLTKFKENNPF